MSTDIEHLVVSQTPVQYLNTAADAQRVGRRWVIFYFRRQFIKWSQWL